MLFTPRSPLDEACVHAKAGNGAAFNFGLTSDDSVALIFGVSVMAGESSLSNGIAAANHSLPPLRESETGVRRKPVLEDQGWKTPWLNPEPSWHSGPTHHWSDDLPDIFRDRYERDCLNSRSVTTVLHAVESHGSRIEDMRLAYELFVRMHDAFTPFGKELIDSHIDALHDRIWPTRDLPEGVPLFAFRTLGDYLSKKQWEKIDPDGSSAATKPLLPSTVFEDYTARLATRREVLEPETAFRAFLVLVSNRYAYPERSLDKEVVRCIVDAIDEAGWTDTLLRHTWRFLEVNHASFDHGAISQFGAFFTTVRKTTEFRRKMVEPFGSFSPPNSSDAGGSIPDEGAQLAGGISAAGVVYENFAPVAGIAGLVMCFPHLIT